MLAESGAKAVCSRPHKLCIHSNPTCSLPESVSDVLLRPSTPRLHPSPAFHALTPGFVFRPLRRLHQHLWWQQRVELSDAASARRLYLYMETPSWAGECPKQLWRPRRLQQGRDIRAFIGRVQAQNMEQKEIVVLDSQNCFVTLKCGNSAVLTSIREPERPLVAGCKITH